MFLIYNLALLLLSPLIVFYYIWRVLLAGKGRESWQQQLGFVPKSLKKKGNQPRVWIQAVSVGETVASAPIFSEVKAQLQDVDLVVSTSTTTGQQMAKKTISEAEHAIYFPLDLAPSVLLSLCCVKPDVFVSVESEIWPNFLAFARLKKIPTLIVNGIISDRTVKRGMKIRPLYKWALSNVDRFLMQTQADADRVVALGASPSKVEVVGNCKFDQGCDQFAEADVVKLRQSFKISSQSKVMVAGSTNLGEDESVLQAFEIARKTHTDLKLVLAPRQIERADEICEMVVSRGFTVGKRSKSDELTGSEDVVILDTFGELAFVYSIADVCVVGGGFISKGGHNILQPIAHGKPVFYGPHMFKSRDLVSQAEAYGVGFQVKDGADLGNQIVNLLSDEKKLAEIRDNALEMIAVNKGASKRCAQAIVEAVRNRFAS